MTVERTFRARESRFINDNVAIHLAYLRNYDEYRITVATLNRPVCFTTSRAPFVERTRNTSSVLVTSETAPVRLIRSTGIPVSILEPSNISEKYFAYYDFRVLEFEPSSDTRPKRGRASIRPIFFAYARVYANKMASRGNARA